MYEEPARPSPTPAPIAPPARARPPPMNAPAVLTASSLTAIDLPFSVPRRGPAPFGYLWCGEPVGSGHWLWLSVARCFTRLVGRVDIGPMWVLVRVVLAV